MSKRLNLNLILASLSNSRKKGNTFNSCNLNNHCSYLTHLAPEKNFSSISYIYFHELLYQALYFYITIIFLSLLQRKHPWLTKQ